MIVFVSRIALSLWTENEEALVSQYIHNAAIVYTLNSPVYFFNA